MDNSFLELPARVYSALARCCSIVGVPVGMVLLLVLVVVIVVCIEVLCSCCCCAAARPNISLDPPVDVMEEADITLAMLVACIPATGAATDGVVDPEVENILSTKSADEEDATVPALVGEGMLEILEEALVVLIAEIAEVALVLAVALTEGDAVIADIPANASSIMEGLLALLPLVAVL